MPWGGSRSGAGRRGRPRAVVTLTGAPPLSVVEAAQRHMPAAIKTLVAIMTNKAAPESARVSAAREILDRGYGKPVPLELLPAGEADGPRQVTIRLVHTGPPGLEGPTSGNGHGTGNGTH